MTADAITEAAARNREKRMAQIARLQPLRGEARQKVEAFRAAQVGAKTAQETLDLMRSLSHVPGFFPTPRAVVSLMLDHADIRAGHSVLEPSAGKGDLIKAALSLGATVRGYEINYTLAEHCHKQGFDVRCCDFLDTVPIVKFDRVLMNPPFERGIDARHIRHAVQFLKPGGRLVAVACSTTGAKLANEFEVIALPVGSFKAADRATGVNTCLVIFY